MKKEIVLLSMAISFLGAEPSAFELQSGATKKDLSTLQSNNKNLQHIATDVQARLEIVEQTQDGLKSLIEGQNLRIKQLVDENNVLKNHVSSLQAQIEVGQEQSREQSEIIDLLKVQILSQQDEIKRLQEALKELNEVVVKNNDEVLHQLELFTKFLMEKKQTLENSNQNSIEGAKITEQDEDEDLQKDHQTLFIDAKNAINKKDYKKAEKILFFLIDKKFRIAESYFMLGDIAYSKKEYQVAVGLYKQSFALDEDAVYMPVLLWRTAWSFKYLKDIKNYERFTDILVKLYPKSEQAQKILELKYKEKRKHDEHDRK